MKETGWEAHVSRNCHLGPSRTIRVPLRSCIWTFLPAGDWNYHASDHISGLMNLGGVSAENVAEVLLVEMQKAPQGHPTQ